MEGLFIDLEGLEKSGKSSHALQLAEYLRQLGYSVVLTREPGGTEFGERIRDIVRNDASLVPVAEMLLFAAPRAQHVAKVIRPALERGDIVVCDRYAATTIAYQGGGRGISMEAIMAVQDIATMGVWPALTVLMDISVETSLKRIAQFGEIGKFEQESIDFMQRARDTYLQMASSATWAVINNEGDEQEAQAQLRKVVLDALKRKGIR